MKKCPFCAEEIQDAAIKCRYCGSQLNQAVTPTAPVSQPTVEPLSDTFEDDLREKETHLVVGTSQVRLVTPKKKTRFVTDPNDRLRPTRTAITIRRIAIGVGTLMMGIILLITVSGKRQAAEQQRAEAKARADAADDRRAYAQYREVAEANARTDTERMARTFEANKRTFEANLESFRAQIVKRQWDDAERTYMTLARGLAPVLRSGLRNSPNVAKVKSQFADLEGKLKAHRAEDFAEEAERLAAIEASDPKTDISVVRATWEKGGFGVIAVWTVTLRNTSKVVRYSDIAYKTEYAAPSGTGLGTGMGKILDVLRPGQTRTFKVNDGFVNTQAHRAYFSITGATKIER